MKLRVAGAQIRVTGDTSANLRTLLRAIDFAADEHAEILLTPEGSLSGYTPRFDSGAVRAGLETITARARAAHLGLALGTCYVEDDGRTYNQIRFYAPDGAFLGFHSKTLTCGTLTDPPRGEIQDYAVRPLRTYLFQEITVGGLICNDLWANPTCTPQPDPHLTQQLARLGARIIFHAVNGGRDGSDLSLHVAWPYHESNLRLRAMAARVWIVTVDNCDPPEHPCSAPSGVLSPRGEWLAKAAPQGEQLFAQTIEGD
jgi:predicted amidohydrolase